MKYTKRENQISKYMFYTAILYFISTTSLIFGQTEELILFIFLGHLGSIITVLLSFIFGHALGWEHKRIDIEEEEE